MQNIKKFIDFTDKEKRIFKSLSSPKKIQDYLNKIPINFEPEGDTAFSPRKVIRENRAHCVEGALLACVALWYHGEKPLLMDLVSNDKDMDHVVALFQRNGYWGAISKTNHAVLRYREPVYRTTRELAMSYFHEYFLNDGNKTLRSYSDPFDLSKLRDINWIISEYNLWDIIELLDDSPHHKILDRKMLSNLRKADKIEIEAGKLIEWKKK